MISAIFKNRQGYSKIDEGNNATRKNKIAKKTKPDHCHEVTFGTSYLLCSFPVSLLFFVLLGFGQGQPRSLWSYRV